MFNLLISYSPESWESSLYECDRSRAIVEYTADELSERYKFFDENAINDSNITGSNERFLLPVRFS